MAITKVQTTAKVTGNSVNTITISFTTPPTVGNLVVIPISIVAGTNSLTTSGCVDNYGNTYILATSITTTPGADTTTGIYYSTIATTGSSFTVTVTKTGTTHHSACGIEFNASAGYGLRLDQIKTASGTSTAVATGASPALIANNEVVIAVFSANGTQGTITVESVSPSWNEEYENLNATTSAAGEADSRILSGGSGATTSCSWTINVSATWSTVLVTFLEEFTAASIRVSQDVIELLSQPVPIVRTSQYVVELLSESTPSVIPSVERSFAL